jgi:hypothetical protein
MTTYCKFLEWSEIGSVSIWTQWYLEMVKSFASHYQKDWECRMVRAFWAMEL